MVWSFSFAGIRLSLKPPSVGAGHAACGDPRGRGVSVPALESEIRNAKVPLPALFAEISCRTDSLWKDFFAELSKKMQDGGDFTFSEEFERLFSIHLAETLTDEEQNLFLRAGRNLLSDDLVFHKNASEQLSLEIREHVAVMKKRLDSQKKVYQVLCLSMSALLVIILL